jgi:hypothetical protein
MQRIYGKRERNTHSFRMPNYQVFVYFLGMSHVWREVILFEAGQQRYVLRSQSDKTNKGWKKVISSKT